MKKYLSVLCMAGALSLPLCAPSAFAREFRDADVQPADYPTVAAVNYMSDLLKQGSKGKYSIKVYPNSQLGSEPDTVEQVKLGAIEFTRTHASVLNAICPETMLPSLPFVFRDKEHMRHVLDGPIGDEILRACESHGLVGLAFYDSGARFFYTKKQIKNLADLKGMKIRVPQSELSVAMLQALHANATPMATSEVYTGIKSGIVDGAENNWPTYQTAHHFEIAPYVLLDEHDMTPEILLMSKVIYDKLSADDQKMIRQTAKASVPYMRKLWDEKEISSRAIVEKAGVHITAANKAEFQASMAPVYAKFVTTPAMKDMLKRIQETK
ncbi:TRAP transporter substrate-binding protein [Collimonas fungivorans]|uniref:TRAP transporter substrate-binding protein n=1 Tax=Collimonas fungivorans TaxID=158899 RepID=UPI003FA38316